MTDPAATADRSGLSARLAAVQAVTRVLRGRGFVHEHLRSLRQRGRLDGRAAAVATDLALGAVRHAITIRHVLRRLARYDERHIRDDLRAILYTATYALIYQSRVPDYAIVSESVSLASRRIHRRAAGMVNAILRSVARAIVSRCEPWHDRDARRVRTGFDSACVFDRPVLPEPDPPARPLAWLAAAAGLKQPLLARWVRHFGWQGAEQSAWASQAIPPIVLQRNSLRCSPQDFERRVRDEFGDAAEITTEAAFLPPSAAVAGSVLIREGLAWVQDPTARRAARTLAVEPSQRVLDLCAAPGGKTLALAIDMHDRGTLVATDLPERIDAVRQAVRRLGLSCVQVRLVGPEAGGDPRLSPDERFDAVLVDVPCSNTGVLARRPEARLGFTDAKLASLVRLQRELLEIAARCVRPSGRLVYSTCSLEQDENEAVVEAFCRQHDGWQVDSSELTLPGWGPRLSDWRDGGFAARLVRQA